MKKYIGPLVGLSIWIFLWWLSGADWPHERGERAVMFVLEACGCTLCGYFFGKAINREEPK